MSGKALSLQSFGGLLTNPLYAGRIVVPRWGFEGAGDFEPLVDAALFDKVQIVLLGRRPRRTGRHLDHPDFPLRRIVSCSSCGAPLTGSWSTSHTGARYGYYRCPRKACRGVNVRKEHLDALLANLLATFSVRPEVFRLLAAVLEDTWREAQRETLAKGKLLASRKADQDRRKDKLVGALLDGKIDQATYDEQTRRLNADRLLLAEEVTREEHRGIDLSATLSFAEQVLRDLRGCWNRLPWQQRPGFLRSLYPGGLVYIDGAIGTADVPWWIRPLGCSTEKPEVLAPPAGIEPARTA